MKDFDYTIEGLVYRDGEQHMITSEFSRLDNMTTDASAEACAYQLGLRNYVFWRNGPC